MGSRRAQHTGLRSALGRPSAPSLPQPFEPSLRKRVLDCRKRLDCSGSKVRRGSLSDAAEQDDAVFIGDGRDGLDHWHGWRLAQGQLEQGHRLSAAHAAKGTGGLGANVSMQIPEQVGKRGDDLASAARQQAGVPADCRIRVAQKGEHGIRRQTRFEAGRRGGRARHRRPLHPSPNHDLCHNPRGVGAADRSERVQGRDLFGQRAVHPVAGETAAITFQHRNGVCQATAAGFRREGWAVGDA